MPRANWKGVISFGLVNIPIMLINSEDTSERVSFHQIDKRDKARIKYARINAETGKEVPWENIIKGYQYDKETILPVNENELQYVAGESARTIAIDNFVNQDNINFINVSKTYYLVPDKKGEKGYAILREALKETKKIGISKVIISTKEYISAIAYYNGALVLYLLRYPSEIKSLENFDIPDEDLKKVKATTKEVDIAKQLIKSMSSKWNPKKYKDEYAEIVHEWAERKIRNKPIKKSKSKDDKKQSNVVDFVDLLKKSLKTKDKPQSSHSKKSHKKKAS